MAQPYYIGPSGDNSTGNGSRSNPWFEVEYAMNQCSPGDSVIALTGTYDYDNTQTINVSGSTGSYIVLTSEGGHPDSVVFDFWDYDMSGSAPQNVNGIAADTEKCLKFEKFSIRRVWKINTNDGRAHGFYFDSCDSIDLDFIKIDSMAGRGILGYQCGPANITNCDWWWCADPQDSDPGNGGTGILWYKTTADANDTVRITGCRGWLCADQGFGLVAGNVTIYDSCWAFNNGIPGYTSGGGQGMKISLGGAADIDTMHVVVKHCISGRNKAYGLNTNTSGGGYKFNLHCYSNTFYANLSWGIHVDSYSSYGDNINRFHNNLSLDNTTWDFGQGAAGISVHSYNSFDAPYNPPGTNQWLNSPATVSTSDFLALPSDSAEFATVLGAARKADGSLPDLGDYFKLAPNSDLIDAGAPVIDEIGEMPYNGGAPDLGAFESNYNKVVGNYYIGPNGNDGSGDGTRWNPWFNASYAMNQCSPGETVVALTGTYDYYLTQIVNVSGTSGNYITLISEDNHPDSVVFDFWSLDSTDSAAGASIYGFYSSSDSCLSFERFSLRRVWKINTNQGRAHGLRIDFADNINFDWLQIDSIAGRGIQGFQSRTANFTNCDFSWCADPQVADPGNAGVGIIWYHASVESFVDTVRVTGCRFWHNADQGIETMHHNVVYVDSCWAWDHNLHAEGYTSGTGNGFKPTLGMDDDTPSTWTRLISMFDRHPWNENTSSGGYKSNLYCYNSLFYGAIVGAGILTTKYPSGGHPERENIYRNNISFDNNTYDLQIVYEVSVPSGADHSYNSFDLPYHTPENTYWMYSPSTVNTSDFIAFPANVAACDTILGADRGPNGELPDLGNYFKLAEGSDLINIGTDVGLEYNGSAPDLGPFESNYVTRKVPRLSGSGNMLLNSSGKPLYIREE
jgi:hypothetical protein